MRVATEMMDLGTQAHLQPLSPHILAVNPMSNCQSHDQLHGPVAVDSIHSMLFALSRLLGNKCSSEVTTHRYKAAARQICSVECFEAASQYMLA